MTESLQQEPQIKMDSTNFLIASSALWCPRRIIRLESIEKTCTSDLWSLCTFIKVFVCPCVYYGAIKSLWGWRVSATVSVGLWMNEWKLNRKTKHIWKVWWQKKKQFYLDTEQHGQQVAEIDHSQLLDSVSDWCIIPFPKGERYMNTSVNTWCGYSCCKVLVSLC